MINNVELIFNYSYSCCILKTWKQEKAILNASSNFEQSL